MAGVGDIVAAVQSQSTEGREVANRIEQIAQGAEQNAVVVQTIEEAERVLSALVREMDTQTRTFKT
jgi:methyl-accepting chemotaxis protein